MTSQALFHDSSRDIVAGFLDDTIRRLGWYAAQAWWAENDALVPGTWAIADAAPAALAALVTGHEPMFTEDAGLRFLEPALIPVQALPCVAECAPELLAMGLTQLVVHDIPGMFDFDVRLVFVPPADVVFTDEIAESLASAARLMPTVIRQEKERQELSHTAGHDPLTGLLNRRGLDSALASLPITDGLRALIFLDLDKFKAVNDTHGHPVGDDVLVDVAQQLAAQIRPSDCLARIGGDEFVMVATSVASPEAALAVAQRLLTAISRDLVSSVGALVSIAASVGVALWRPDETMGEALAAADRLMYEAKRFGGGIASEDPTGRILISDAWSEPREWADAGADRPAFGVEVVRDLTTDSPWGALVSLGGELSSVPATTVATLIRDGLAHDGILGGGLVLELDGLGWSRGDQLAGLLDALTATAPASSLQLMLTASSSTEAMRLAVAEARARFDVGVVLIGGGTDAAALAGVETDRPGALALSRDVTASLAGDSPRLTLVRMVVAVADVIGVPVIARAVPAGDARARLAEAGCRLGTFITAPALAAGQSAPALAAGHSPEETA